MYVMKWKPKHTGPKLKFSVAKDIIKHKNETKKKSQQTCLNKKLFYMKNGMLHFGKYKIKKRRTI